MDLRPYLDELEQFADGQLSAAQQEAFELRLEQDPQLTAAYEAYEQLTADLRWAAGHQSLREQLLTLDHRLDQREAALKRAQGMVRRRQQRWLLGGGVLLLAVLAVAWWAWRRPVQAQQPSDWQTYYQPEAGPTPTPALAQRQPLLHEALVQYRAGHYPAALHTLARVGQAKANPDTLSYLRGVFLLRQGEGLAAQPYLRRVQEQGPAALARRARYHLGMAYWQAGQLSQAKNQLHQVATDSLSDYHRLAQQAEAAVAEAAAR